METGDASACGLQVGGGLLLFISDDGRMEELLLAFIMAAAFGHLNMLLPDEFSDDLDLVRRDGRTVLIGMRRQTGMLMRWISCAGGIESLCDGVIGLLLNRGLRIVVVGWAFAGEAAVDRHCSSVGVGEDGGGGAVDCCCRRRRGRWAAVSLNRNSLPLRWHFGQLRLVIGGVASGGFARIVAVILARLDWPTGRRRRSSPPAAMAAGIGEDDGAP
ncbi:hypothetical protein ACLOJK_037895 [Asimina triloba]